MSTMTANSELADRVFKLCKGYGRNAATLIEELDMLRKSNKWDAVAERAGQICAYNEASRVSGKLYGNITNNGWDIPKVIAHVSVAAAHLAREANVGELQTSRPVLRGVAAESVSRVGKFYAEVLEWAIAIEAAEPATEDQ